MTSICDCLNKFRKMTLSEKMKDLLLHYKRGHDGFYVEKASIYKEELAEVEKTLEFYCTGWVQKRSRLDEYKVPREVFKNHPVQEDHGVRAASALKLFKGDK